MPISDAPARLRPPDADADKYKRGKVVVVGGAMAGAAHLAAIAAQRSAAGYVELLVDTPDQAPPYALVRRAWSESALADPRIGAIGIGPGLGDDQLSRDRLEAVLAIGKPAVIDAGALGLLRRMGVERLRAAPAPRLLTPHRGEFERQFGPVGEAPADAARRAAERSGAIVLLKGNRTIVAHPDGRVATAPPASPWLATAGTGDVLTGIAATMLAQMDWHGFDPFAAARMAVWLHTRAAALAGPALIADDLLVHLPKAIGEA